MTSEHETLLRRHIHDVWDAGNPAAVGEFLDEATCDTSRLLGHLSDGPSRSTCSPVSVPPSPAPASRRKTTRYRQR